MRGRATINALAGVELCMPVLTKIWLPSLQACAARGRIVSLQSYIGTSHRRGTCRVPHAVCVWVDG